MWNAGVLLIILAIQSQSLGDSTDHFDDDPDRAPRPKLVVGEIYDLAARHLTPTMVLVTWRFEKPKKADKKYISFSVEIKSLHETRYTKLPYSDLPRGMPVGGLKTNRRHTVKIRPTYDLAGHTNQSVGIRESHGGEEMIEFITWDGTSPQLERPTIVMAETLNPTEVLLTWDFVKPVNVTSGETAFYVELTDERGKVRRQRVLNATSLRIKRLLPDTDYNFIIWATHENCSDSSAQSGKFTTMTHSEAILSTPTHVQVGHKNTAQVIIAWQFVKSSKPLRMHDVKFVVKYSSIHVPSLPEDQVVHWAKPMKQLSCRLEELKANTTYSVKIQALHSNWLPSAPLMANFTTMASNWSAPNITHVKRSISDDTEESASFEVKWDLNQPYSLRGFVLENCDEHSNCTRQLHRADGRSGKIFVPYEKSFSVSVAANFLQPITGTFQLRSTKVEKKGAVGKPSAVVNISGHQDISTGRGEVRWDPPIEPRGPISHYSIEMYKPVNNVLVLMSASKGNGTMSPFSVAMSEVETVVMKVKAVNVDSIHFEPPHNFSSDYRDIKIVKYKPFPEPCYSFSPGQDEIEFELVGEYPGFDILDYSSDFGRLTSLTARAGIVRGLCPYLGVNITLRACFVHPRAENEVEAWTCGEETFRLRTIASNPDPVLDLQVEKVSEMVVAVTWKPPKIHHGPISRYEILVEESGRRIRNETVDGKTLKHRIINLSANSTHRFGVAAVNYQSFENRRLKFTGKFEWVELPSSWSHILISLGVGVVFVTAAVVGILGEHFCRRKRQRRRSD